MHRQAREWQPWLDWAALTYDAPLRVTRGIAYVKQHRDSVAALRRAVAALDVPALAALGVAVPALGSLVLGLALAEGRLDAATAHALGCLDELFQAEAWGEDAEAAAGVARDRGRHRARGALSATDTTGGSGMNCKRLIISGRVQGVGYREWMVEKATRPGRFGLGTQPAGRFGGGTGGRRHRRRRGTAASLPPRPAHGRGGQHRGGSRRSAGAVRLPSRTVGLISGVGFSPGTAGTSSARLRQERPRRVAGWPPAKPRRHQRCVQQIACGKSVSQPLHRHGSICTSFVPMGLPQPVTAS